MIENYTRLSSRMFTATVVGKDKNGRKITEGRETYKTPSGVYEIKDWARLVEKAAEAGGAFAEIYPGTEYEAILVDKITTEDGTEMVGCTTFPDDGTLPLVEVAGHIPAEAVPEILAHELAHIVTVGDEHGPEWKKAFEAIYSKYNELAIARFGTQEPEENQKGGD